MIIVFSRSTELNGIGEIKRALPKLNHNYVAVDDLMGLILLLTRRENQIDAIFSLSSNDYLLALCVTRLVGKKIAHISGVFHPRQWYVMLDERVSRKRAAVFRRVMNKTSAKNIVYNSTSAYASCMKILKIYGDPNLCIPPSITPLEKPSNEIDSDDGCLKIVTIGRFVNFKTPSILRMIELVDLINDSKAISLRYYIYGSGPDQHILASKISKLKNPDFVKMMGPVSRENFSNVVSGSDLFFGMGFSVVHAAMLKVPSLVAIQGELGPYTYGYFSDFDHSVEPVFGDEMPSLEKKNISDILFQFIAKKASERMIIGEKCKVAAKVYEGSEVEARLTRIIGFAERENAPFVSFLEILKIRLDTWLARTKKIDAEQT